MRGTLPPQAYTREVLAHAFNWLQGQNDAVKTLAQTPDTLVSLYLQAKRKGDLTFDESIPSESFRSQLKTLATDLQQFVPAKPAETETVGNLTFDNARPSASFQTPTSAYNPPLPLQPTNYQAPVQQPVHPTSNQQTYMQQPHRSPSTHQSQFDSRTLEILQKVRHHFNLSSDAEALRMLVTLGFERIHNLIES